MSADVAVVGAGPVGLTLAGRLAQRGLQVTVVERARGHVGEGSKAICMQRETLEIWAREGVGLELTTDAGVRQLWARYLVGADGAHSSVRDLSGIAFPGHSHTDQFLICDIRARLPYPRERRFFFDPPWNPGRQVLIHPQPDDTWRIDWQIPPETDVDIESASGGLDRRIRSVIGPATPYELVWMTAYRFHQRLADNFRAGNVFLAGDAAHLYAP